MSLKILGGNFRGFPLAMPRALTTRPTSALVKRKLFDWRQNMEGYTFIDLCAGSGAMGFEALSRGADKIFLNDSLRGAFLTLKDNKSKVAQAFKVEDASVVLTNLESLHWVSKELNYQIKDFEDCILYLDPPYEDHELYFSLLDKLKEQGYTGEVWLESDRLVGPAEEKLTGAFHSIIKKVVQGDHFVLVGKLV